MFGFDLQSPVKKSKTGEKVNLSEKAVADGSTDPLSELTRFTNFISDDGLEIDDYREMMSRDAQVAAAVNLKIMARLSSGWIVEPASAQAQDRKVADFINDQLSGMDGSFYRFLSRSMLSMAYGHTFHEIVLEHREKGRWKGHIGLKALKWKRPEQMRVAADKYGNVTAVEQHVHNEWRPLQPQYFCYHAWDHEGDWVGKSQLRAAYRWYKAKQLIDTFWNVYLEKYAMPTPIGAHPPGISEVDKREMLQFITSINGKKGAVFPKNWEVSFLEAMRSGGSAGYEEKVKYCDRMEARALLMPTLLFDEGDSGAYALGQQHAKNFVWVLEALGSEFAEGMIEEQLIRFLVDLNFDVDQYPKFRFKPFEPVDLAKMAEAYAKLIEKGVVSHDETFLRERMELPPLEEGATPPAPLGQSPAAPPKVDDDKEGAHGDGDPMIRPEQRKPEGSPKAVEMSAQEELEFAARSSRNASKFDHRDVVTRFNAMEEAATASLADLTAEMKASILRQMRQKKIIANRDFKAVDALRIPGTTTKAFRETLESLYGDALHNGVLDAQAEVRRGGFSDDVGDVSGFNLSGESPEGDEYSQADIIDFWESKVPIQRELLRIYSRNAFTVSGVFRDDILDGAQRVISRGLRRGAGHHMIEADLSEFFKPYIGGGASGALGDPFRIETIVLTAMSEAYNTGRMNYFRHPSISKSIAAFEYSAIIDRNTTPFCREWHGTVLAADDPRVAANTPPNHFRCRSVWVPVMRGEKFTLTDGDSVSGQLPQSGFLGCAFDRAESE